LCLAEVSNVRYFEENGEWRLEGSFSLNASRSQQIIELASNFADERNAIVFLIGQERDNSKRLGFPCSARTKGAAIVHVGWQQRLCDGAGKSRD
jgi:hypothetical protein